MGRKAMTVAQLHDQYVSIAGWDVYTGESNLGSYPPDHQTRPRAHAGPQGPRPAAAHRSRSLKSYIMALAELQPSVFPELH
jgi:hypothetical protein